MTPKTMIQKARAWATTVQNLEMYELSALLGALAHEIEQPQRWISVEDEKPEEEQDVQVLIPKYGNPAEGWCVPKIMRYYASIWEFEGEHWGGNTPHYWRPLGEVTP